MEDNSGDIKLLEEAFRRNNVGADVVVAPDGQRAVEMISEMETGSRSMPELVILDLNIPKRSGHEVLRYLRGTDRCRDLPVVILTSSEAPVDRDAAFALGVKRYLIKPSNLQEFMRLGGVIRKTLEG